MPLLRKWEYKGAVCGIWKVTENKEYLCNMLSELSYLDLELSDYKSDSRKIEYLSVRVLLKELLGYSVRILHKNSGKPYLDSENLNISISHTNGYVAVCLHKSQEVGIDIEYFSDRVMKVSSRFVRDDETWNIHYENSSSWNIYRLLLIWSAKETLFKVMEQSEVDFKEHMRIFPFSCNRSVSEPLQELGFTGYGVMKSQEYKTNIQSIFSIDYFIHKDFVCTFCVAD